MVLVDTADPDPLLLAPSTDGVEIELGRAALQPHRVTLTGYIEDDEFGRSFVVVAVDGLRDVVLWNHIPGSVPSRPAEN